MHLSRFSPSCLQVAAVEATGAAGASAGVVEVLAAAGASGVAAPMGDKARILFICTANAARSQMAEGCLRAKYGDRYEVFSAGIHPAGRVTPRAIAVMQEIGIDISGHRSKPLGIFNGVPFDLAVTLCDNVHAV